MANFNFLGSFLGKGSNFSKEGHDTSSKEVMSLPFGINVPLASRYVVPNEHYKCRFGMYVQTAPMREDNFAELYNNLAGVYVPISSVWRDYVSMTSSARSTRMDPLYNVPQAFPIFHLMDLVYNWIAPMYVTQRIFSYIHSHYSDYLDSALFESAKEQIGYYGPNDGVWHVLIDENTTVAAERVFLYSLISSPNKIASATLAQILDTLQYYRTTSGCLLCFDALRLLDNLGYANWIPFLERSIKSFETEVMAQQFGEALGPFVFDYGSAGVEIESFLPMIQWAPDFAATNEPYFQVPSALPLICYAYANDVLFRSNYRNPSQGLLTWDYFLRLSAENRLNTSAFVYDSTTKTLKLDFAPITHTLWNDWQTSLQSFYDNGYWNNEDSITFEFQLRLFSLTSPLLQPDVFTTSQLSVVSGSIPTTDYSSLQSNLIQTIADKTALYKIRQDLLRSGVRRDKQMEVMFGVDNGQDLYNDVYVLDKTYNRVDIQSLLNQAETDQAPLGARGARGNGSSFLEFRCDTKDFGYVFVIANFTTPNYYEAFGLDYANILAPSSWFNPRNNYLGLEAVPSPTLSIYGNQFGAPDRCLADIRNVGFSARDWYIKTNYNKVHGLFTNYPLPLVLADEDNTFRYRRDLNLQRGNAYFGGYISTLLDQQTDLYRSSSDLYFNPYMVNNLFVEMFDGVVNGDFSYDHFRCAFTFEVHKVSPFPKLGLLKLD